MTDILAEAGRITGLGPAIGGKVIFGVQPASAKYTGAKPTMFIASASQLTGLGEDDLVIVRFSRFENDTKAGPVSVASLSLM